MARTKAAKDNYLNTGTKTKASERREKTESGRLAAFIIDKIKIPDKYKNKWDDYYFNNYGLSEAQLVNAIVDSCGRYIKYCPQIGWLVYKEEEGRWTELYAKSVVHRVITHFGSLLLENAAESNPGEITFARRILSSAGINAVENILKHHTIIAVERDRFDSDPDLLNCMGDWYNLRKGETRPCEPEDMFSKSTRCKAAALKKLKEGGWEFPLLTNPQMAKLFEEFLDKITSKEGVRRSDLAYYIMSYFGYCLTGDNGASFFVNFHGQGANGKSELMLLMMALFGDYAMPLPKDIVIENKFQSQFDLAGLPGIRLGMLIDAPKGNLNIDQLKSIVSGDAINAKRKYHDDFTFNPVCKIVVGSNPKLKLKDTGLAVRRRIRMIPFDYIVPENERETHYHKKLLNEAPEILALLIWFAHEYYKRGEGLKAFPRCAVVDEASSEYLDSEDLVGRWLTERTEPVKGDTVIPEVNTVSSKDMYDDFRRWANSEGITKVMANSTFGEYLSTKVKKKRISSLGDETHYLNIKLKYKTSPPGSGSG